MKILDLTTQKLGLQSFSDIWLLQRELVEARAADLIDDTLILVEHEPVYTVGRAVTTVAREEQTAAALATGDVVTFPSEIKVPRVGSVPVFAVERGGQWTYHGPGQLVGYPIFKLHNHDLRHFLRETEQALMQVLKKEFHLDVKPCPETLLLEPNQLQTGVWLHDQKIASLGISVRKWVTYHGFALNVAPDLRYFEAIEPCGFNGSVMTSILAHLDRVGSKMSSSGRAEPAIDLMTRAKRAVMDEFTWRFGDATTTAANPVLPTNNTTLPTWKALTPDLLERLRNV